MSELAYPDQRSSNFREVLETAFLLRRRVIGFAVLVMVAALAAAVLVRPNYVARSELIVLPSDEYTFRATAGSTSLANGAMSLQTIMTSETAILNSPSLARAVIRRIGVKTLYPNMLRKPGLFARAKAELHELMSPHGNTKTKLSLVSRAIPVFESHLTVLAATQSDVITVSFAHPDPVVAKLVLATLETLYLKRRRALFADPQSAAVANEVSRLRAVLDQAEARLAKFQADNHVLRFQTQEVILLNQQGSMEQDLMTADNRVAQLTASIATLDRERGVIPKTVRLQQNTDIGERTASLRGSLDRLRTKLASLSGDYRTGSPMMKNLQSEIGREAALLARATADNAPSVLQSGRNPVSDQVDLDLLRDKTALTAAQARVAQDRHALGIIRRRLHLLSAIKLKFNNLERQKKVASDNYVAAAAVLSDRVLVEQVNAAKRASVRILSPARLPIYPAPLRRIIVLLGAIIAVIGSVLIVLLANFFRKGVLQARVFEIDSGIPVLAVVPELADAPALALWRQP